MSKGRVVGIRGPRTAKDIFVVLAGVGALILSFVRLTQG